MLSSLKYPYQSKVVNTRLIYLEVHEATLLKYVNITLTVDLPLKYFPCR